jgi:DNA repair protein RecO (recombination protein O)
VLTLGELVFFDTGRSDLVRIDHFDVLDPFAAVREDLERLGRGAWAVECVVRLTADRDPHPALFRLLVRGLQALDTGRAPDRVAACFGLRAVDLLGHRPRIDRCLPCGRPYPFPGARLDVDAGGLVCARCRADADALPVSGGVVGTLRRLRTASWEEGLRLALARGPEQELSRLVEGLVTRLIGQPPRASRFLEQTRQGLP